MNDKAIGSDILAVLGIVVLEREAGGQFRMIGSAPYWLLQLCPWARSPWERRARPEEIGGVTLAGTGEGVEVAFLTLAGKMLEPSS